jgi:hypothetical protein
VSAEESTSDNNINILSKKSETSINSNIKLKESVSCGCKNSRPGIINLDPHTHEAGCWIRKRLVTGKYTFDTSVNPKKMGGYSLGVAC